MSKKLCPFLKTYILDYSEFEPHTTVPTTYAYHEEFQECVKEKCMSWYSNRIARGNYWEVIEYCKLCQNRS